jgi:hypothetical protein
MSAREITLRSGRKWMVSSSDPVVIPGVSWGACLLASSTDLPEELAERWTKAALSAECKRIAVAAPNGEVVHDRIDSIIEANEAYDVVTTWHDGGDALEEAIRTLEWGGAGPGPVHAYSTDPDLLEAQLSAAALPTDSGAV